MITKEEYEAAKRIVDEYEKLERDVDDLDEFVDGMDDREGQDPLEDEWENCTCGAYQVSPKTGKIIKISDCIC